ncbi:hypothetical protein ACQB6R_04030 [Propionibacteriaceae bacterium G1746]|uniref:hypothetical protein n=1 Tax=Aestuariimicrobium sp. G57 TaxID=3418485 RepID=UPI003C26496D
MSAPRLPAELAELVQSQDGVMTRTQALAGGLSRTQLQRLPDRGWQRLLRGVYSCAGDGWQQRAWAGVLAGGPRATLGGLAAAKLHGLHRGPVDLVEVRVPPSASAVRSQPGWVFRRGDRLGIGAPARLPVEQTVLDLCAGAGIDEQAGWLTGALVKRRTTPARLRAALEGSTRFKGRASVVQLVEWLDGGIESPLELRYRRDVEQAHSLPAGERQRSMSKRKRTDVVYAEWNTLVELDGELGHRGEGEVRDAWRDAEHLAMGLGTMRFGWLDILHCPCGVAAWWRGCCASAGGRATRRHVLPAEPDRQ